MGQNCSNCRSGLRKQSEELIRAMTNSAPKLNNKVERHSPKWSGKKQRSCPAANNQQQRKPAVPISIPPRTQSSSRWLSSSPSSMSSGGWSPKSHQSPFSASAKTSRRSYQSSPGSVSSRTESPRGSPTYNFYAGSKFAESPSPLSLPKPPTHWTGSDCAMQQMVDCPFTAHLKMVLKVQAWCQPGFIANRIWAPSTTPPMRSSPKSTGHFSKKLDLFK